MTVRPNYFTGQFLKEADFVLEQEYHQKLSRLHNLYSHTSGVANGLMVSKAGTIDVTVSPGAALDGLGRVIELDAPRTKSFSGKAAGTYYLVISYSETLADETNETGVKGFTRMVEDAVIEVSTGLPGATSKKVPLAKVIVADNAGTKSIQSVDNSARKVSGAIAGESLTIAKDPLAVAGSQALKVDGGAYIAGSIGIGTTAPSAKLHVGGDLKIDVGEGLHVLGDNNYFATNQDARILRLLDGNGSAGVVDGGFAIEGYTPGDDQRKPLLAIRGNGNVGIGTSSPGHKLDVAGATQVGYLKVKPQNKTNEGGEIQLLGAGSNPAWQIDSYSNRFRIHSGGEKMTILSNGNVGIGTATPQNKLHLRGVSDGAIKSDAHDRPGLAITGHYPQIDLFSSVNNGSHGPTIRLGGYNDDNKNTFKQWVIGTSGRNSRFLDIGFSANNDPNPHAGIRNYNGSTKMTLLDNGNVGIGRPEPGHKLDINSSDPYPLKIQSPSGFMYCGAGNIHHFHFHTDRGSYYFNKPAYAVSGFHTYSTIKLKKNVTYLSQETEDEISEELTNMKLAKFRYRDQSVSRRVHLGVIAEEAPLQILSENGDAVDLYNYTSFSIAALKSQVRNIKRANKKIEGLETRVIEQKQLLNKLNKTAGGCDFSEYFKSVNGNPLDSGTSIVMEKEKVRPARKGETPIGVISASPSVLGGFYSEWPKKYLKDLFGNDIIEEYEEEILEQKTEKVKRERQKVKTKTIENEVVETVEEKVKGKKVMVEIKKKEKREIDEPQFKKIEIYDEKKKEVLRTEQVPVMETYEVEESVFDENGAPVMVSTGKFEKKSRLKLNPDYDPDREYIPRDKRPEWNVVGLLGQIPLRKGQPTAPGWVKLKDLSKDVELWLVK